jgi:hypothetical protein
MVLGCEKHVLRAIIISCGMGLVRKNPTVMENESITIEAQTWAGIHTRTTRISRINPESQMSA